MKKKKETQSINSNAYAYLRGLLAPGVKIVDAYVEGKWLRAELSSGPRLSVRNQSLD